MNRRQRITLLIIGIILILFVLIGITYAYFVTRINGNITESVNAKTLKLELVYGENDPTVKFEDNVLPGYSVSKEFKVTNNGSSEDYYSIKMENVKNTFDRREDIIYIIYREGIEIKRGMLPNTESWLVYKEKIEVDETINYKITVEYLNKEEDQSEDMNKDVSFKVNIDSRIDDYFTNAKEGTLIAAIARDNVISKTLTVPGISVSSFKFYDDGMDNTIKNVNISIANQELKYYTYASTYTFNEKTGKYTLVNPEVGKYSEIYNELKGKYIVNVYGADNSNAASSTNLTTIYQIKEATTANTNTLQYVTSEKTIYGTEKELSYTEDDYGTSYYYRGDVRNNYVDFANKCWRIVRVQGDGSIKITLYDEGSLCEESKPNNEGAFISKDGQKIRAAYNTTSDTKDSLRFAGSETERVLKEWYETEFENNEEMSKYANQINQEAKWCNDMSENVASNGSISFGAYYRLYDTHIYIGPLSLTCNFIGNNGTKSEIYTGPAALLTADEMLYAGNTYTWGGAGDKVSYYLKENAKRDHVTMSPSSVDSLVRISDDHSLFGNQGITPKRAIRPVLVLKPNMLIVDGGDGTLQSPYVIE